MTDDIAQRMTTTYQLGAASGGPREDVHMAACASGRLSESFWISIRPQEVHHEKNSPADCGAAFGFFTCALVSCGRHDFFRGLALLHGH